MRCVRSVTNLVENAMVLFALNNYFPNCSEVMDYKKQKIASKSVIFMAYTTISKNRKDKRLIQMIDNIVNNQLLSRQFRGTKKKEDRQFLFYPYNKETKKIVSDITIQLYLQEDGKGNYEIKMELKGKDVNFKSPGGSEMKKSITYNKKHFDSGDYTEFVYKLNDLVSGAYIYNILF